MQNMRNLRKTLFVLLLSTWMLLPALSEAQYMTNGKDIFRVQSGETLGKKILALNFYQASHFREDEQRGGGTRVNSFTTMAITGTYGLFNSLDVIAEFVPWQDDYTATVWGPLGDTRLGLKWRIPQYFGDNMHVGLLGFTVLPTADQHRIPFEQYSSSGTSFGGKLLYSWDTQLGAVPFKLYLNGGYMLWNGDDDDNPIPLDNKDQVLLGVGTKFSFRKIVLMAEYTREQFVETDSLASKEQAQRFNVGIKVPAPFGLTLDLGYEQTLSDDDPSTPFVADYHDWKIIAAIKKVFFFNEDEERRKRMMLLERIRQEEEQRLKSIEEERKDVEQEIEDLKKLIEEGDEE